MKFSLPIPLNEVLRISSLRSYDDLVTSKSNNFENVDHYYSVASCRQYLADIKIPTLIINSLDDPFVPQHSIPKDDELSPFITLELAQQGGHAGFIQNKRSARQRYCESRTPGFINDHLI